MKNNEIPLDVHTLTMENIKEGQPLENDRCPVALMLDNNP